MHGATIKITTKYFECASAFLPLLSGKTIAYFLRRIILLSVASTELFHIIS